MKDFDHEISETNLVTAHLLHVCQRLDVILNEINDFSKGKSKHNRHLYSMAAGRVRQSKVHLLDAHKSVTDIRRKIQAIKKIQALKNFTTSIVKLEKMIPRNKFFEQ